MTWTRTSIFLLLLLSSSCTLSPTKTPGTCDIAMAPDGSRIRYYARSGGDIALVFVHGGLCNSSFWSDQLAALEDYRVVTLDLAGHGGSGAARTRWTLQAFAEDVRAVVTDLSLERVVLVGNSMGGPVCLRAARLMPERVVGVIGVDTLHDAGRERNVETRKRRIDAFRRDYAGSVNAMVDQCFHSNADADLIARVRGEMQRVPRDVGVAVVDIFTEYDMAAEMARTPVPIRCINGDLVPTNVARNRNSAPGFDAVIMEGAGHFPMLERPEEFNGHLENLVRDILASRRP